jgi:hypothetical protein
LIFNAHVLAERNGETVHQAVVERMNSGRDGLRNKNNNCGRPEGREETKMPEIFDLSGEDTGDYALRIYNLKWAVGEGCANPTHEVMLVQWLLKRHFERKDKKSMVNKFWLMVNGQYDKQLADIIRIYQYDVIQSSARTRVEMTGQLFPVRQLQQLDKYALVNLNMSVKSYFSDYYKNPAKDPFLPHEFKAVMGALGKI